MLNFHFNYTVTCCNICITTLTLNILLQGVWYGIQSRFDRATCQK